LILSGANSFGGSATVSSGTLVLNNSAALADGTSLTVGSAAFFAGDIQPAGGASANAPLAAADPPSGYPAIAPVPEPGTLALLGAILTGTLVYRRARKQVRRRVS
jgi:autotransporter-associated beta strand protein